MTHNHARKTCEEDGEASAAAAHGGRDRAHGGRTGGAGGVGAHAPRARGGCRSAETASRPQGSGGRQGDLRLRSAPWPRGGERHQRLPGVSPAGLGAQASDGAAEVRVRGASDVRMRGTSEVRMRKKTRGAHAGHIRRAHARNTRNAHAGKTRDARALRTRGARALRTKSLFGFNSSLTHIRGEHA